MASAAPGHARHAVVPLWRDIRVLRLAAQVVVILLVGSLVAFLLSNLFGNMARTRLTLSLDFLSTTAGFEISHNLIPYSATDTYGRAFLVGLLNTLMVSVVGIVLATILGVVVGVARLSSNWLLNRIASGYVELMRNTPLLVQLVLIFAVFQQLPSVANSIALPGPVFLNQRGAFIPRPVAQPGFGIWLGMIAIGIGFLVAATLYARWREDRGRPIRGLRRLGVAVAVLTPILGWFLLPGGPIAFDVPVLERFNFRGGFVLSSPLVALLVGLVFYTAAFIGEVVRGAIQAVRRGQVEAAMAIGLSRGQTLRLVVFPQALRIIVPPLTSQYLNLAKNSSLAIAIGYPDLFSVSQTMSNQTGQPVSVIVLLMATYLSISLSISLVLNIYNRRVQVLEH